MIQLRLVPLLLSWMAVFSLSTFAQQDAGAPKKADESLRADDPVANPGRPTVSTPATLTPVGYLQFETGYLGAWRSPEFSSQSSLNEVLKFSFARWIELLAVAGPFAHSLVEHKSGNGVGGVALGAQAVVHHSEGGRPTIALSYLGQVYGGNTPDLDLGSPRSALLILASGDARGFHYDTNFGFNEVVDSTKRRAQYGQTLSISHALVNRFGISWEIWHLTQPFLRSNAVGNLWALNFNARKNLVFDGGFNRGFTSTSTQWEAFVGFTYLLPHKLLRRSGERFR